MKKIVAILAGGLLAMSAAQADSVNATASSTKSGATWADALSLQQFNSALGNLTSVVFSYEGTVKSIFKGENENKGGEGEQVSASTTDSLVFGLPISSTLNFSFSTLSTLSAYDGVTDFAGNSGFTTTGTSTKIGPSSVTVTSGLATYTNPYAITVTSNALSSVLAPFSLISSASTTASAKIDVIYNYTPTTETQRVPEPGSLALIGLALAGLGVMRRKSAKA